MAANELDAATGFVEGSELNRSPASATAMRPARHLDSARADTRLLPVAQDAEAVPMPK